MDMGFDATWCIYSAFLNFFSRWDDFIDGIDAPIFFKKSASFIGASVASGVGFSLMGLLFPPARRQHRCGALLAAITATRFAGVSWETSAAKKIVKAFEKADVVSKYNSVISEYWSKIATAFDVSAKKVDADWEQYLQNLSTLIQSCDQSSIREQSEELRSLLVFLGQCPQKLSPQLSILEKGMFNMSNLFEKYRSAGNDEAALMVANNEFNKAPGDKAAFEQYFSFVCSLGTSLPSLLDRQAALDKAAVALEYFKENAELDEKLVEWILAKQTSLEDCYEALAREDNELMKKQALDVENENNTVLKRLFDLRDELQEVKTTGCV